MVCDMAVLDTDDGIQDVACGGWCTLKELFKKSNILYPSSRSGASTVKLVR